MTPTNSAQVAVLALGSWGTALAHHIAEVGHSVVGWVSDPVIAQTINETRHHPKVFPEQKLSQRLRVTTDLSEALEASYVVLAFPAAAIASFVPKLQQIKKEVTIISAIKGFEDGTLRTPLQAIAAIRGNDSPRAVISGPTFAADIIKGMPAGIVVGARREATANQVATLLYGRSVKTYISTDPLGVELGGAVKNVIALAAGMGDGLGLGDSARAMLITRGLAEMVRLGTKLGVDPQTLYGLSGLGDLVMTATSTVSRNYRAGIRLGRGEKLSDVLQTIGTVVEGAHTAPLLVDLGRAHQVELPISEQVTQVLRGEVAPSEAVKNLVTRPVRREFYSV